jgi:hypothetical protein
MKSILLLFIACYLISINVFSQEEKWVKYIGLPNRDEYGHGLIEYYDNSYFIVGAIVDQDYTKGWSIKSDINGSILWDKALTHYQSDLSSRAVALDENGNTYVCGVIWSDYIGNWPIVMKFNACGEKQWCRILKDEQYDHGAGVDIKINENGEIIILTWLFLDEYSDLVFLFGLDDNGNVLWEKPYASQSSYSWIRYPLPYRLLISNNEYYIAGSCYWPYPDDTTHWYLRPMFIGIDSLFYEKWMIPFYALDSIFGQAYNLTKLNDSIFIGVGDRWLDNDSKNSIFMYFDSEGQELGYTQMPNASIGPDIIANVARGVVQVNDSLLMSLSVWSDTPEGKLGFFVFDTTGSIFNLHEDIYCATAEDLIKTFDGNYVAIANVNSPDPNIYLTKFDENLNPVPFDTNTYTYDSLCPEPIQSGTIDLSDCLVWTGAEEIPSPEEYYSFIATIPINAYPNPAETEITLAFENTEHHSNMLLECYNIYGQKVHSEKIWKGQQQTKLVVSGWGKGLYFAVVKSNGKVAGQCRFVRK